MSLVPIIALHQIAGVSTFNARCSSAPSQEDVEELAASILVHGVTTPLTLRVENGRCVALDGGRRLAALRALSERGEIDVNFPVPHLMFSGSDEEAAEVSLISFVQRRDLHPVDEFERFAELRDRFALDAEQIAKKTGKSLRFVKERLRLARLAPKVREAWRAGKIVAEVAQAFSVSESHAEQERVFAEHVEDFIGDADTHIDPDDIRGELRGEAVRATNREAIFVGVEAYAAAGGALDEQLFEKDTWFLDAPLLRRLAQEKLERIGEEIVAREGWGWACYDHKDCERWTDSKEPFEADYTEAENERLDEIEAALGELEDGEEKDRLDAEQEEIETRALLRAISRDERATLGIHVYLDFNGRIAAVRGLLFEPKPRATRDDSAGGETNSLAPGRPRRESAREGAAHADAPASPSPEPIGKSLRAVLDEAANKALSEVVSRNVSLALVVAVAALGCSYSVEALDMNSHSAARHGSNNRLLKRLCEERFERALPLCLAAHQEDAAQIPAAFAELVAGLFAVQKPASFDPARILLSVAAPLADIDGALDLALDREAFFKANPREAALEAIRALDGDAAANDAAKLKKPELIQRAALLAKDRHWLPDTLRAAILAPKDERTTAQAMVEAIEADEASGAQTSDVAIREDRSAAAAADEAPHAPVAAQASAPADDAAASAGAGDADGAASGEENAEEAPAETARARVAEFLNDCCRRDEAGRVRASELAAAYEDYAAYRGWLPLGPNHLAKALADNRVDKTRLKNGVHYLGLALHARESDVAARQAAE